MLADLRQIDLKLIEGRAEAVTYKFLQNLLETAQGYRVCRLELWNVSPTWTGWQAEMPVIAGMQTTSTPTDQVNAVARFSQLPKYLDDEIANLKEGLRLKYSARPRSSQTTLTQFGLWYVARSRIGVARVATSADGSDASSPAS